VIGTRHEPRRRIEGRAGGVFKTLPRFQKRLLPNNAFTVYVLCTAVRIGDPPGTAEKLDRLTSFVLDFDPIGPDVAAFFRLRLVLEVEGANRNPHASRSLGVVFSHKAIQGVQFSSVQRGSCQGLGQILHQVGRILQTNR